MKSIVLALTLLMVGSHLGQAAVVTKTITYELEGVKLEGFLAYDDASATPKPGVLVIHNWLGVGDYVKSRCQQLAELGYVAFAADIYGQGIRPKNSQEAGAETSKYRNNRPLMRQRAQAGLDELKKQPQVDANRLASIGYCFGGSVALELARSGADLKGTVSFHGGLSTPTPQDAKNIKGKVLALHGADDPHVPMDEVAAFQKEMREAGVDWYFTAYGSAVHSFTEKEAGNDPSKGAAYNEKADKRSWQAMQDFFEEIFR